jgi:hypothetical protein
MRIAIFGLHPDTQASYRPEDWDQVWRMAHDPEAASATRVFEAHSEPIARKYGGEAYLARLREFAEDGVLMTLWPYEFTKPTGYHTKRPQSSVSFMAWAALNWIGYGRAGVGFFGVDMSDGEEYGYQRPDMMRVIGHFEASRIPVHIDPASSLLKSQWTAGIYGHPDNIDDMVYRLG